MTGPDLLAAKSHDANVALLPPNEWFAKEGGAPARLMSTPGAGGEAQPLA